MSTLISTISVDLGAKYNGVHLGNFTQGESFLEGEYKGIIIVDNNKKQWSQAQRRSVRHAQRSLNRRRLSKRFLRLILKKGIGLDLEIKINNFQTLENFIMGLLNRRGYTYLDEGIDYQALEENEIKERFLKQVKLEKLNSEPLSSIIEQLVRENKSQYIRELLREEKTTKNGEIKKEVIKDFKLYDESIEAVEKAINEGHKHREQYLSTIKQDILNLTPSCLQNKLTAIELWFIIGNISNFQLRILRKYFNDERMVKEDVWDEEKFNKLFNKYISGWHVKTNNEKNRLKELKKNINLSGLELLKKVDPSLTIPPFEDQNNRNPPKCQTLVLKPEILDRALPNWKTFAARISNDYNVEFGFSDKNKNKDKDLLVRKFQIYLDGHLKIKASKRSEIILNFLANGKNDQLETFIKKYFEEIYEAKYGFWTKDSESVLTECNLKTKHKSNISHYLIGDVFLSPELFKTEKSIIELRKFLKNTKVGRKGLQGILKDCAEAQENWGNSLNFHISKVLKNSTDQNKELKKLLDEVNLASVELKRYFSHTDDKSKKYSNIYSFAQIYNHLEKDAHGFSKTCVFCAKDNSFRINLPEEERISRLSKGPEKPIDGIVGRLLDSIAWKIALEKEKQISNYKHVANIKNIILPIAIEENVFSFSQDLKSIKKDNGGINAKLNKGIEKDKKKVERTISRFEEKWARIKNDSQGVCPYTGEVINELGEYDHIIPRSQTRDQYQTVFNSELNLIYCSSKGNRLKGEKVYNLENLNRNYLVKVWGNYSNDEIKKSIIEKFEKLLEKDKYERIDLFEEENRKVLRLALFIDEIKDKAGWLVNKLSASKVNGTQKYFSSILSKKIDLIISRNKNWPQVEKKFVFINASERFDLREMLHAADPDDSRWAKEGVQSLQSHVIDAALVFAKACEDRKIANELLTTNIVFSEENVTEIKKIIPRSFEIVTLESRHKSEKDPSGIKIMAATMTSENYLPILAIKKDNEIIWKMGFSENNSIEIKNNKKSIEWKKHLLPFLTFKKDKLISFEDIEKSLKENSYICLNINRYLVNEENFRLKNNGEAFNPELVKILEACSYKTRRKACSDIFIEVKNNKLVGLNSLEKVNELTQIKISNNPMLVDGIIFLPVRNKLDKIFGDISNLSIDELNNTFWQKYFPPKTISLKNHKSVKKVYSLPVISNEGNIRLRRKTPANQSVWQIQKNGAPIYKGFIIKDEKLVAVPSENSVRHSFDQANENDGELISMAKFIEVQVPDSLTEKGVLSLSFCLSEEKRRRCQARITIHTIQNIVQDFDSDQLKNEYSIKEFKNLWFSDSLLKSIRGDKFYLIACTEDSVLIEFTHEGSSEINQAIIKAIQSS